MAVDKGQHEAAIAAMFDEIGSVSDPTVAVGATFDEIGSVSDPTVAVGAMFDGMGLSQK